MYSSDLIDYSKLTLNYRVKKLLMLVTHSCISILKESIVYSFIPFHTFMYLSLSLYIYVCMYVYIYTHTHTYRGWLISKLLFGSRGVTIVFPIFKVQKVDPNREKRLIQTNWFPIYYALRSNFIFFETFLLFIKPVLKLFISINSEKFLDH